MEYNLAKTLPEFYKAFNIISKIGNYYPNFTSWYFDKVIPGVCLENDKIIIAKHKNEIIGVSIIKDTPHEKKLRAIRIEDKFQKRGYGLYLIDHSLKLLNTDKPNLSVPEEMINEYSRIFINKYKFNLDMVHKGIYRKNKLEYEFNGKNILLPKQNINYGIGKLYE